MSPLRRLTALLTILLLAQVNLAASGLACVSPRGTRASRLAAGAMHDGTMHGANSAGVAAAPASPTCAAGSHDECAPPGSSGGCASMACASSGMASASTSVRAVAAAPSSPVVRIAPLRTGGAPAPEPPPPRA